MDFGLWQIAIVLVIALIVFGPKRLPELGRSLGFGMREFKDSITGKHDENGRRRAQAELEVQGAAPPREGAEPVEDEVNRRPKA